MPNVTTVSADFTVKSGQWLVVVVLVIKTVPGLGGGLEKKKESRFERSLWTRFGIVDYKRSHVRSRRSGGFRYFHAFCNSLNWTKRRRLEK